MSPIPTYATEAALLTVLAVALGYAWYAGGRGRWRSLVDDRFVYGVPWGTLVTVVLVVTFYLVPQGGLCHWSDPLTVPFLSWSYFYPMGMLTSGVAHNSPEHLINNMTGTLVFGPIAEYAWSHYPPGNRRGEASDGWLSRPWVRAVVIFPAAMLGVAVLTSLLSVGFTLGFSAAAFASVGFAVVNYPAWTVVAVVATDVLRTLYRAVTEPVVRESFGTGASSAPEWAGIAFQGHLLGFLCGVLAGIALLAWRTHRPRRERVFFGVFLVGIGQSLWLISIAPDDVSVLYRGVGVAFVIALTVLIAAAVAGSERSLPRPLSVLPRSPTRRHLAAGWLLLLGLGVVGSGLGTMVGDAPVSPAEVVLLSGLLGVVLAVPALAPFVPDRLYAGPISRRQTAALCLAVLTTLIAVVSVPFGLLVVGDDAGPDANGVDVRDYTVSYVENASMNRTIAVLNESVHNHESGVVVRSRDRQIMSATVRPELLDHYGNETVEVGALGWRETVLVERTGWDVVGNGTVYAVDVTVGGETTRSFRSEPRRANVRVDGHAIAVAPTTRGFVLRVTDGDGMVGESRVPDAGEVTTVGDLRFRAETDGERVRIVAHIDDTSTQIAARETYAER